MGTRITGFVGERLKSARAARALTAAALAEIVGVTPGAVSQYENGGSCPKDDVLARVASALSLPVAHFVRDVPAKETKPYFYRSLSSATKTARNSAEVRMEWFRDVVACTEELVELPTPNIPEFDVPKDPAALSDDDIEKLAERTRQYWGMGEGPIADSLALIEAHGVAVSRFSFGAPELSAFSQSGSARPFIALNADSGGGFGPRYRMDAMHELGHLVLHRNVPANMANRVSDRFTLIENQAFRFAAAFLFPAKAFAEEVYSIGIDSLLSVKRRWKMSVQALVRRAFDLKRISEGQYSYAFRQLSAKGFRRVEPLDDLMPAERPRLIAEALILAVGEGVVSRDELRYRLPYGDRDIETLAGLPVGFLSEDSWGSLVSISTKESGKQMKPSPPATSDDAKVIQFKRQG